MEERQIDANVVGDVPPIRFGEVCECGHGVVVKRHNETVAKVELKAREVAHRLRHPFKERRPFAEWLESQPDVSDPSELAGEMVAFDAGD